MEIQNRVPGPPQNPIFFSGWFPKDGIRKKKLHTKEGVINIALDKRHRQSAERWYSDFVLLKVNCWQDGS